MFYATKIQSIQGNIAIDENGKRLTFIGYLPVHAGDTVYTDGTIIFGNVPAKGGSLLVEEEEEPSGIPVLADKDSETEAEMRGYITENGKYKTYKIAGENWIVNDKLTYYHDTTDGNIIDAEVAVDEDGKEVGIYTVNKEIQQLGESTINNILYKRRRKRAWSYHYYYSLFRANLEALITDATEAALMTIYEYPLFTESDDKKYDYVKKGDVVKDCILTIQKESATGEEQKIVKVSELMADIEALTQSKVNIEIPEHNYEDYVLSMASVKNFKINSDGSWVALVECNICVERKVYEKTNYRELKQGHSSTSRTIPVEQADEVNSGTLKGAIKNLVASLVDCRYLGIDEYEYFTVVENDVNYTLPSSTLAIETCVFKITTDKITSERVIDKVFLKGKYIPLYFVDEVEVYSNENTDEIQESEFPSLITINKHYYWTGNYTIMATFNPVLYILEGMTTIDDARTRVYQNVYYWKYDSRYLDGTPDYNNGVFELAESFSFPIQDGYLAKFKQVGQIEISDDDTETTGDDVETTDNKKIIWRLEGIYDKDGNEILSNPLQSSVDAHTWNLSFAKLKNGRCFLGIHGDKLYRNGKQIGEGLKNFRLRELKKISKAK